MFEAVTESLNIFGFNDFKEKGDDYTRTETQIICHVAEKERLLELRSKFDLPVIYRPHPFLFTESTIKKASPPLCLVLRGRDDAEPKEILRTARSKGYRIATIDDCSMKFRAKRRAYREAAVIIACSLESEWSEVLLCASKTPFICKQSTSKIARDYLRLSGLREKVSNFSPRGFNSLIHNYTLFVHTACFCIQRLFNIYSWKSVEIAHYTKNGYALIRSPSELDGKAILYPWVGVVDDASALDKPEFIASKLMCVGIVFNQIPETVADDWNWKVVKREPSIFKTWSGQVLMACADSTCVRYNLQTKRGVQAELELEPNEILVLETFNYELIKEAIKRGVPFVSAPYDSMPDFLAGYKGIQTIRFMPVDVQKLLSPQFVIEIATQMMQLRKEIALKELDF